MKDVVIFDLDGTLVDVVPLFVDILNTLAPEFGYSPLREADVAKVRKMSLTKFLFTKLGLRFWRYQEFHERGRELYRARLSSIRWFPGMPELYRELQARGIRIGIISTNSAQAITGLVEQQSLTVDFIASTSFFGKSQSLQRTVQENNLDRESVIYVGDEIRDIHACQKIGLDIIAVTWGLNAGAALKKEGVPIADSPLALRALLLG